jgi:hypothetical protein
MTTGRTAARLIAAVAATGLAAPMLFAPPAEAAGSLSGTITWTRTVTLTTNNPGVLTESGTETTTGSLGVTLSGISPSSKSGQGTDRAPKVKGTVTGNTTANSYDGGAVCTQVSSVTGVAGGKDFVAGTVAAKGSKKALIVYAQPKYTATNTTTTSGVEGPRCTPLGTFTRTYPADLSPNPDRSTVCLPAGSAPLVGSPVAFTLVGVWNAKKKAYVFDCSATYPLPYDRGTATVRIKGSLR